MPQRLFKEPVRIAEKYPAGREGDLKTAMARGSKEFRYAPPPLFI